MNKDIHGLPFWIDLEGRVHHFIKGGIEGDYSFENIVKKLSKLDNWHSTHIKMFKDGVFLKNYIYINETIIITYEPFIKVATILRPDILI